VDPVITAFFPLSMPFSLKLVSLHDHLQAFPPEIM
jgi:hypothetical protein